MATAFNASMPITCRHCFADNGKKQTLKRRRTAPVVSMALSRRQLLKVLLVGSGSVAAEISTPLNEALGVESTVFRVRSEADSPVTLESIDRSNALTELCSADAILLGVAHGSASDHALAAEFIRSIIDKSTRPVGVAFEAVEYGFQKALDAYTTGKMSELDFYFASEWEDRWGWPYEAALPLLRCMRLCATGGSIALGTPAEILARVRTNGGLANLSNAEMRYAFADPKGFFEMSSEAQFREYVREVITPSYAAHARMGLLSTYANFEKFYTARVVSDESMAATCKRFLDERPSMVIAVLGKEHVKFGYGVPLRLKRLLGDGARVCTVVFNARAEDAWDSKAGALRLEMGTWKTSERGGVLIADYLWYSSLGQASSRKSAKKPFALPQVERLVLPESLTQNTRN